MKERPVPRDTQRHVFRDYDLYLLKPYLNWQMLLGKHLGVKGAVSELLAAGDRRALELKELVDEVLAEAARLKLIQAHGMYRFFPAQAEGDTVVIYDPLEPGEIRERIRFPRQAHPPYLCLADYLQPVQSGEMDFLGMFAVTAGVGVREVAERLIARGEYLKAHVYQALAIELAEAFAERIHQMMRDAWGFPDPMEMTMAERFRAKYRGIRVSFGYPACPDLTNQEILFRLLRPQDIGIELTESHMMDPEASVTALVFSHPEARHFSV